MFKIFYSVFFFLAPSLSFAGTLQDFAANLAKDSKIKSIKIAVMDINTTETGSRQDAIIVRERITTFLLHNSVGLVERGLLDKVLQEQRLQATGAVGQDTAKQIGELTGADAIFTGTLAEITDTSIELNARIIDVKTGEIISAGQVMFKKDWKAPPATPIKESDISTDNAQTYFNRGIEYYSEGKYSVSIDFFSKAIKENTAYLDAYYYRGSIYLLKGNFEEAISDFSEVLEVKPDYFEACFNRGVAYSNTGNHEKALHDYSKAIELSPEFADAYHNRGVTYDNLARSLSVSNEQKSTEYLNKAIIDYSKAIELNPKSDMSYYYRARIYDSHFNQPAPKSGTTNEEKALSDYNAFLNLNPNDANGHFFRGLIYHTSGDAERAIRDYEKTLGIDSGYKMAHYNLASIYYEQGRYDNAIRYFQEAIKVSPWGTFSLLHHMGDAYWRLGKLKQAEETYRQLIVKFPEEYYAYTKLGILGLANADQLAAVSYLSKAILLWSEKEGHPFIPLTGNLPCFKKAPALNSEGLYALSLAQKKLAKNEEASVNLQKAMALDPSIKGLSLKELGNRVFNFEAYCKNNLKLFQELDVNLNKPWRPANVK